MKRFEKMLALVAVASLALTISFASTEATGSEAAMWQMGDLECSDFTKCSGSAGCSGPGSYDNCVLTCTGGGTVYCNGLE